MRTHYKKYIIATTPRKIYQNWKVVKLKDELYISFCPVLNCEKIKLQSGEEWYVLGNLLNTNLQNKTVEQSLHDFSLDRVLQDSYYWAGRWMLVGKDMILTDASCLIGCYFSLLDSQLFISNSPFLVAEYNGDAKLRYPLYRKDNISWYPVPSTGFHNVSTLLPSQYIKLLDNSKLTIVPFLIKQKHDSLTHKQKMDLVKQLLNKEIEQVAALSKGKIYVALSAGDESRLIAALCAENKIDFDIYTQVSWSSSKGDVSIPKKIAEKLGREYRLIKKSSFSREKYVDFLKHTGGHSLDADLEFYSHNQWREFPNEAFVLRGIVLDILKTSSYYKYFTDLPYEDYSINVMLTKLREWRSEVRSDLEDWFSWVMQHPGNHVRLVDRFLIEQKLCGWAAHVDAGVDLAGVNSIQIANSRMMMSLAYSFAKEVRDSKSIHYELIYGVDPQLMKIKFNPADPFYLRIKNKIRKKIFRKNVSTYFSNVGSNFS